MGRTRKGFGCLPLKLAAHVNFKDEIHTSKIYGQNFPELMKANITNLGPISFSVFLSNDKFRAPWSRNDVMQVLSHNSNKTLNQQTHNNIIDNYKNKTNILLSFPIKTPLLISEASFIFFHVIFFSFFCFSLCRVLVPPYLYRRFRLSCW